MLDPRNREAKAALAEMQSALGHTYDSLGMIQEARDAYLNAYRLRVELADSDPTNKFSASQVMKSRLDLLRLQAHTHNDDQMSFTEREALFNLRNEKGRNLSRLAGLEAYWLLYSAEFALQMNQIAEASRHTSDLMHLLDPAANKDASVTEMAKLMAMLLGKALLKKDYETIEVGSELGPNDALDCRSSINRWLFLTLQGMSDSAEVELDALHQKNFSPRYLAFYRELGRNLKK